MPMIKKYLLIKAAILIALFTLINHQIVFAEDVKKIVILPFEIYSKASVSELREAAYKGLSTELVKSKNIQLIERSTFTKAIEGKKIDEKLALNVGKELGADYVIMGSLTAFGEQISVDARVIDIKEGRTFPAVYAHGRGIKSIDSISAQIRTNIIIKIAADMRIAKIEFKGNRKIESSAIKQVLKSVKGNLFSEADLSADIKAIYKMGYFDDVAADITNAPEGKIITFIVKEKALISEIRIKGNKGLDKGDIENTLTFKVKQVINPEKMAASIEKIKALYDSKGYYNAEIKYEVTKEGEKDVIVTFNITENERLYIKTISFDGNRAFTDKELKNIMTTSEKGLLYLFTDSGILKRDQLKQDTDKLAAFYLNHGYINVQVGEPIITHDRKGIYIKIPIVEGKQFKVGKVDITGDALTVPRSELLEKLKINKLEFYNRESVIKDMEYLVRVCNDDGYANADVTPRTVPQEKDQAVDVSYNIKKGNQAYINMITFTGNTRTRDKVMRRQLSINEGDLYSSSKLKQSYESLNRLRYFEEINLQTEKGPDETLTNVNINVKEKQTGMFSIGGGYSAIDHAIGTAQISQQNLFGRGQTLSLKANIGGLSSLYELTFIEPWLFDIPLWSKFDLWNSYRQWDSYSVYSTGFGMTYGYPLLSLGKNVVGYLGYKFSLNDVSNVLPTASQLILEEVGKESCSMLSPSIKRDTTDDIMFPSKGSRNSIGIDFAGGPLQGDERFIRYGIKSTWFFPMPLDTVFAIRGQAGYLQGSNDVKEVPIYERYYLGGLETLRGLRDVGPRDPLTGDPLGGFTMLCFNIEYVFPLIKNAGIKGVVFYDTGNAWMSGYHFDDFRKTTGLGVRWYSPIGPLRLEWGYVLDQKKYEPASRFEFTIGMFM
ncbi:MAG TPA: outer membrane protein assembly factor BamA [Syntrophales bacterium]|nr:outer membrane protein assembly factor BamA [Syntrophales bacterium]